MITRIMLKGFKGSTVDLPLGPKMLIVGPNGSGKSSIVQAIELVLTGGITGVAKATAAIGDAGGAPFAVEATIAGVEFNRSFRRSGDSIQQTLYVDRVKVGQAIFDRRLGECGAPTIWQPESFFALPPGQQISQLTSKFVGQDSEAAVAELEKTKRLIDVQHAGIRQDETLLGHHLQQGANLAITAESGSLAEVQAEIRRLSDELAVDRAELAKIEREQKQLETQKRVEAIVGAAEPPKGQQLQLQDPDAARAAEDRLRARMPAPGPMTAPRVAPGPNWMQLAFALLDKIEAGLEAVSCPACKSGLVAGIIKVERSKFEGLRKGERHGN